ncbi:MAG: hypothetical protein ACRCVW_02570 [Brevinema sp.]
MPNLESLTEIENTIKENLTKKIQEYQEIILYNDQMKKIINGFIPDIIKQLGATNEQKTIGNFQFIIDNNHYAIDLVVHNNDKSLSSPRLLLFKN